MSSTDPSPIPLEPDPQDKIVPQSPWGPPSGSPLDRPPTDGIVVPDTGNRIAYPDRYDKEPLPPPRKPHPHIGWAILWLIGFMLVTQGLGAIISVILLVVQIFLAPNRDDLFRQLSDAKAVANSPDFARMMWPGMLITQLIVIVAGWAALRIIAGRNWPRKVALRLPSLPHFILVLLAVPAFMLLGEAVDSFAKQYVRSLIDLDQATAMIGYWPWWLGVLIIGFGAGIGEELIFRAYLGRGLVANHGVIFGVILTSILFGIWHVEPRQVIYAPFMGVCLHCIYLWTRSLLMPMLVHTLNNGLAACMAWWTKSHLEPHSNAAGMFGGYPLASSMEKSEWVVKMNDACYSHLGYAGAAVLMAAVMIGLYMSRARLTGVDGGPPPWQPGYANVEFPPSGSDTVVTRPLRESLLALGLASLGLLVLLACCYKASA